MISNEKGTTSLSGKDGCCCIGIAIPLGSVRELASELRPDVEVLDEIDGTEK